MLKVSPIIKVVVVVVVVKSNLRRHSAISHIHSTLVQGHLPTVRRYEQRIW